MNTALRIAIAILAPNRVVQAALLVGSYGESGWDPTAVSPGAYGAFQFTPPGSYGPGSEVGASPAAQVAAILAEYVAVAAKVPPNLTGPAQAEWIALGAERPEYYEEDQATIEVTNAPTTYGANSSYAVQNWATIEAIMDIPKGGTMDLVQTPDGQYYELAIYSGNTAWRKMSTAIGDAYVAAGYPCLTGPQATARLADWAVHTATP